MADMKPQPPVTPAALARPIQAAMRENPVIRAALARLRPEDRAHAHKAIAEAIAARLEREGWGE
jgi:hypothetical protein